MRRLKFGLWVAAAIIAALPSLSCGPMWASPPAVDQPSGDTEFLMRLLRGTPVAGPQPYVCPSANADRWEFGDNFATTRTWHALH
jgi:hypothetical protein